MAPSNPPAAVAPAAGPAIKSRKPTGEVAPPLILLDGPEKSGKSLIPVVLSRSDRVGATYWFDLGEGAADEYAALEGSDYEVIEHDGSYREILEQLTAVWHEAHRASVAQEPPVVVVVDSASREWTMLTDWTNNRAKRSRNGQRKLSQDPDAEIDPTSNLWNDANKRHYRIMNLLMTFPGIAVVTARGKWVAVIGEDGQPTQEKVWKTEGQKNLAYDVTAWISLTRDPRGQVLRGVRSLKVTEGFELPTIDVPVLGGSWKVFDLEAFVFDVLGYNPKNAPRDLRLLHGDDLEPLLDLVASCPTEPTLQALWNDHKAKLHPEQRAAFLAAVNNRLEYLRTDWSEPDAPAGEDPSAGDDQAPGGGGPEASPTGTEATGGGGPETPATGPTDADKLAAAAAARPDPDADALAEHDRGEDVSEEDRARQPGPNDVALDLDGVDA